jgi:hypothetical protein
MVPAQPHPVDTVDAIKQAEKGYTQHVEDNNSLKGNDLEVEYDAQEDGKPRTGMRRLLTRNPSYEFIREVAKKDQEELDPVRVRAVSANFESRDLPPLPLSADICL